MQEDILKSIRESSRSESDRILEEAKREANAILKERRTEYKTELRSTKEALKKEQDNKYNLVLAKANRKAAQIEFQEKERLIQQTIQLAWDKLLKLKDKNYDKFLSAVIARGKGTAGTPCLVYCVRPEDEMKVGKGSGVQVSKPDTDFLKNQLESGGGGVIITSPDGSILLDYTFKGLLERKNDTIRIGVSQRLFEEE